MNSSARGAIVVVAICSWFAISNHCALVALAAKTDSAQAGCPFHSKPAKQDKQSTEAQCCKILRAVAPLPTKSWARDDAKLSNTNDCRSEGARIFSDSPTILVPLLLDTGPPRAQSFAELILQRSLPIHAPPGQA